MFAGLGIFFHMTSRPLVIKNCLSQDRNMSSGVLWSTLPNILFGGAARTTICCPVIELQTSKQAV